MQCEEKYYTYIYRDPSRLNNKNLPEEIYVGKGKDLRAWDHINYPSKKKHSFPHRLAFMKRNGIDPLIEIISALDESHAFLMEMCLIEVIGRKDLGKGSLLNLTNGGEGMSGNIRSPETRAKIGRANIGKDRTHTKKAKLKISKSCKGRKDTKVAKEKKKIANTGEKNNNVKLTKEDIIEIYFSNLDLSILSTRYGVSRSHIWSIRHKKYWKSVTKDFP